MLSRIAESLFWIGRYVERAEDTSRILDVHVQQMVEDPMVDEASSAWALLGVMGLDVAELAGTGPIDADRVLQELCYNPDSAGSVLFALAAARDSARRARDAVSVEVWEAINTTHNEVLGDGFRRLRPTAAFGTVRDRCNMIGGLADQTMSHDEGWQFLRLGRMLERVDMTARLLASAALNRSSDIVWLSTLRACGGHHTFLRISGGAAPAQDAPQFLMQDSMFPRSLVHCLAEAEEALAELDVTRRRGAIADRPSMLVGRARANLQFRTGAELIENLPASMAEVQQQAREASEAISKKYFEGADAALWQGGQL